MNRIYEKLFHTYGDELLRELELYDEEEITSRLPGEALEESTLTTLNNLFFEYYYRWSVSAFSLGLHLGLSLLYDDIRRPGPQQVQ